MKLTHFFAFFCNSITLFYNPLHNAVKFTLHYRRNIQNLIFKHIFTSEQANYIFYISSCFLDIKAECFNQTMYLKQKSHSVTERLFLNPKQSSGFSGYHLKCANALFASAILCVSSFFLYAVPVLLKASKSSEASLSLIL